MSEAEAPTSAKFVAARTSQIPALEALAAAAYARYVPRLGYEPPAMRPDFAQQIARGAVEIAGCPDGLLAYLIHFQDGADWVVDNLAVAPAAQGQGLGRALLAHAETRARAAGAARLTLFTNLVMTENQALYRRLGFTETGRRPYKGTHIVDYAKSLDEAAP
ncbi:MAG: GNAT family N-acetyltransferase [Pseudomonadota bacterium]